MSDDAITVIQVTVARVIDEDGRMDVVVTTPASYSAVELIGLLYFAQLYIANELRAR